LKPPMRGTIEWSWGRGIPPPSLPRSPSKVRRSEASARGVTGRHHLTVQPLVPSKS
jgi:hypothetical protein